MVLHLLFHVAECLILPSILVGLGGHLSEESAAAMDGETVIIEEAIEAKSGYQYAFLEYTDNPLYDLDFCQIRPPTNKATTK